MDLITRTLDIWHWAIAHDMTLSAIHIAGQDNILADNLSRTFVDTHEWQMKDSVLELIFQRFMKGMKNTIPPVRSFVPQWSLSVVLKALSAKPFESLARTDLRLLTFKVAFLVAVTSARHASELAALRIDSPYTVFHADKVVLRPDPAFLPKVVSSFHLGQDITLPSFFPSPTSPIESALHTLDEERQQKLNWLRVLAKGAKRTHAESPGKISAPEMEKAPSTAPTLPALTAAPFLYQDLRASPTHIRSKVEKLPLVTTSPPSSLGASNAPGLLGSQPQPPPSGGGGTRTQDLRLPKRRPTPGKPYQCSGDGCRLACRSLKELLDHMRVHYRPTQSLEGKTFRCSTLGCMESFADMQGLMGHMKAHYKPNRYFKCENCMSRFRTHRSLFKHLHSCSDLASGASPALTAEKPVLTSTSGPEKEPPTKLPEEPPKLQSVIQQLKTEALRAEAALGPEVLPAELHVPSESVPPATAHPCPLLEQSLLGPPSLARFSGPPHPSVAGPPFLPYMHPGTYALPQAAVHNRLRPFLPAQGLPVSNAVWKKSQGHSSNSRIVWEHTRGRYNCMQCPYSTASREEMTQHTEDHRKNPSPPGRLDGEMDFGVALPSFHPKLSPEVEGSLFSPL
ncbi:uncharacterized protein LOC134413212 [Elgaria multicarinata webbii]|uniref:uncharacterized protein LOC134413212 n=1 Tax=Elgaria multicarinata webbii TaxID=159646 RepID=UPI002FCCFA50